MSQSLSVSVSGDVWTKTIVTTVLQQFQYCKTWLADFFYGGATLFHLRRSRFDFRLILKIRRRQLNSSYSSYSCTVHFLHNYVTVFVTEQLGHCSHVSVLWTQIHVDQHPWSWRRLQEQSSHLVMIGTAMRTTPIVNGSLRHLPAR